MTVNQLSIFLENKPGSLSKLTKVLTDNKINLRAISLADAPDFGIARILVDDSNKVAEILKANDYIIKVTSVLILEIKDEFGSLNSILELLSKNDRNVEYMYGFTGHKTNTACMIVRTTDVPKTEEILTKANVHLISDDELRQL
ncbi:MAG: ACT domain-containing protein [Treponema sp.]|jgi:hypothetical protein|nr:ACT domain-containing protein [Treponema sp.]